ncbi:MAG: hypothetical protein HY744_16600 [Deltaproteobacteria bacterium]|nr:hypothetical protein [Deltaproteobacteria bacterium]
MLRSPDEALRLAEDVRAEIEAIARVVADAEQILARSGPGEPERMLVYAAGAVLHSFYTGVEIARNPSKKINRQGAENAKEET